MTVAGEMVESYVSFNVGKVLDIWFSLVKALSSLRRSTNGDAEVGLEVLQLLGKEVNSTLDNKMPNDDIVRYVIRHLATSQENVRGLRTNIDAATSVLEKIRMSQPTTQSERLKAEKILLSMVDQLKPIAKKHQDKFASLMFGTERF
jgi:hypothetical protein